MMILSKLDKTHVGYPSVVSLIQQGAVHLDLRGFVYKELNPWVCMRSLGIMFNESRASRTQS